MPPQRSCPQCDRPIGPKAPLCRTCYRRARYALYPEPHRARQRKYNATHALVQREYARQYVAAHPEEKRARDRQYRLANAEQDRERHRRYRALHPDMLRRMVDRRRAMKRAAFVENVWRDHIFTRDGGVCQICKQPVERNEMSLDHIVPLAEGGKHENRNVQLAHRLCNSLRRNLGSAQTRLF